MCILGAAKTLMLNTNDSNLISFQNSFKQFKMEKFIIRGLHYLIQDSPLIAKDRVSKIR